MTSPGPIEEESDHSRAYARARERLSTVCAGLTARLRWSPCVLRGAQSEGFLLLALTRATNFGFGDLAFEILAASHSPAQKRRERRSDVTFGFWMGGRVEVDHYKNCKNWASIR